MNFLTRREVAELLRVSLRTLTTYTAAGLIPSPYQRGRRKLWDETAIHEFMQRPVPVFVSGAVPVNRSRGRPRLIR